MLCGTSKVIRCRGEDLGPGVAHRHRAERGGWGGGFATCRVPYRTLASARAGWRLENGAREDRGRHRAMTESTCKAADGDKTVRAKGCCDRHYRSWRKGKMGKPRHPSCNEAGCGKAPLRRGLC